MRAGISLTDHEIKFVQQSDDKAESSLKELITGVEGAIDAVEKYVNKTRQKEELNVVKEKENAVKEADRRKKAQDKLSDNGAKARAKQRTSHGGTLEMTSALFSHETGGQTNPTLCYRRRIALYWHYTRSRGALRRRHRKRGR